MTNPKCSHPETFTADVMVKECSQCHEIIDHPWIAEVERLQKRLDRINEKWPHVTEVERVRTLCEVAYGIWSRNRGPESEAADRMADILNEILQGSPPAHEPEKQA